MYRPENYEKPIITFLQVKPHFLDSKHIKI